MLTLLAPEGSLVVGAAVSLDGREAHHGRVRRVGIGTTVRLVDGVGHEAEGTMTSSGDTVTVEIERVRQNPRPPETTVAVGAGDRERFAWMVEKLTELAVTTVIPLETDRTAGVATRVREQHLDRFRQRAREALKQCGATWLPNILPPVSVPAFADLAGPVVGEERRWLARAGARPETEPLDGRPVTIGVGPEGGWTMEEEAMFVDLGFRPVGLSPHVLRFETAALAGATLVAVLRQV